MDDNVITRAIKLIANDKIEEMLNVINNQLDGTIPSDKCILREMSKGQLVTICGFINSFREH